MPTFNTMNAMNHLLRRNVTSQLRRAVHESKTTRVGQRRSMGGGGAQPESQSSQARLFEGHPTTPEGWETPVYLTYAASAVLITMALGFAPDTSINTVSLYV